MMSATASSYFRHLPNTSLHFVIAFVTALVLGVRSQVLSTSTAALVLLVPFQQEQARDPVSL